MILFLISLVILIILHELAHLIVAKKCKCGVEVYSIGFCKPYLAKKFGNTEYRISPWIFGGYCRLKGELDECEDKDAFINLSYRKKFAIAVAGVATNMIIGLFIGYLGLIIRNYYLYYFGSLSFLLGATNWFIPIPCLDGGYILWFPLLTKIFGKKRGIRYFSYAVKISLTIIVLLNLLCIPLLIILFLKGKIC